MISIPRAMPGRGQFALDVGERDTRLERVAIAGAAQADPLAARDRGIDDPGNNALRPGRVSLAEQRVATDEVGWPRATNRPSEASSGVGQVEPRGRVALYISFYSLYLGDFSPSILTKLKGYDIYRRYRKS
jgi:hypothetical protein